nr:unnamed protein product [Callosobruchus chinensis]CAH7746166.1 unnamed protein product [Callosobruchus chinensis]CAH7748777.1 unnamed protein product [Callosobruchus chinensis]
MQSGEGQFDSSVTRP